MSAEATTDDDRAIQALGLGHAIRILERVTKSSLADTKAQLKLEIAGLERAAEILQHKTKMLEAAA